MFKIYETRENREELMKKILSEDPCVALVIALGQSLFLCDLI